MSEEGIWGEQMKKWNCFPTNAGDGGEKGGAIVTDKERLD
jgi:hypothetical protein